MILGIRTGGRPLGVVVEPVVAPLDRGAQGALSLRQITSTARGNGNAASSRYAARPEKAASPVRQQVRGRAAGCRAGDRPLRPLRPLRPFVRLPGGATDEQLDRRLVRQRLDRQLPLGTQCSGAREVASYHLTHNSADDRLDRVEMLEVVQNRRHRDPEPATTSSSALKPNRLRHRGAYRVRLPQPRRSPTKNTPSGN